MNKPSITDTEVRARLRIIPPAPVWARRPLILLSDEHDMQGEGGQALVFTLWRALRQVMQWVETAESDRHEAFSMPTESVKARLAMALETAPELTTTLNALAALATAADQLDASCIATACARVRRWAEKHDLLWTASLFADAAAYVDPEAAGHANQAGRLCRRVGDRERACVWYARAAALARAACDYREQARAHLWYGFLRFNEANYRSASKHFRTAGRIARQFGQRPQGGQAHHGLLNLATDTGAFASGIAHATRALALYPVHHPRIPAFVHDIGYHLVLNLHHSAALDLFHAMYPLVSAPHERIVVAGNLARAAAGAGRHDRFRSAATEVRALSEQTEENSSRGLYAVAEGARFAGEIPQARDFACAAIEVGDRRGDAEPVRRARQLLADLDSGVGPRGDIPLPDACEGLVLEALRRIRKWSANPRGTAGDILRRGMWVDEDPPPPVDE